MTTRVNITELESNQKQKKNMNLNFQDEVCDISKVKYFKCQKLGDYANKCPDPKN